MIVYERKGTISPLTPRDSSSSTPPFRNPIENNFQPKVIFPRSWCNFCKEHDKEATCEVRKSARDKIFGKRPETTIVVLDFTDPDDVMIINTRNKSYTPKGKYDPPRNYSSPISSSPAAMVRFLRFLTIKEQLPLFQIQYSESVGQHQSRCHPLGHGCHP
jgi:hypothetical protein